MTVIQKQKIRIIWKILFIYLLQQE